MSTPRSHGSHGTMWLVTLIVVLLYFLSVPPLGRMNAVAAVSGGHLTVAFPRWMEIYATPYRIASRAAPLKKLLVAYEQWVWDISGPLR